MEYFLFLNRETGIFNLRFTVIALLASISDLIIVSCIVTGATKKPGIGGQAELFIPLLCALIVWFVCRRYILNHTAGSVEKLVCEIRQRVAENVNYSELLQLEAAGDVAIQQALAQDCQTLYDTARDIVTPVASIGFLLSCLIYIVFISPTSFLWLVGLLSGYLLLQIYTQRSFEQEYTRASVEDGRFFNRLNDLLQGFKELRINRAKAKDLLDNDVKVGAQRAARIRLVILRKLNVGTVLFQGSFYAMLGMIVFVLPSLVDQKQFPVVQVLTVTTFMLGPLWEIALSIPALTRATAATQRISALEGQLATAQPKNKAPAPIAPSPTDFQTLRCIQLGFRYPPQPGREDDTFQVGPLDLELKRGEIVFLIGGNGSGKSTLLRLLCGLYAATAGRIEVNDKLQTPDQHRAYFSIILQDFHLFERLLGQPHIDLERVAQLLKALNLQGLTAIDAQGRITNTNLSVGQKKRLALLVTECDDREIVIFDEWAADQDPEFRRYFYEVYLRGLRARGKTILAATHDDHYFHVADRVLRLDRGQISTMVRAALAGPPPA